MRGEERYLPKRDLGPRRRFVREWVDGRRTAAELFLPVAVVILILGLFGGSAVARALSMLIWLPLVIALIGAFVPRPLVGRFVARGPGGNSARSCCGIRTR